MFLPGRPGEGTVGWVRSHPDRFLLLRGHLRQRPRGPQLFQAGLRGSGQHLLGPELRRQERAEQAFPRTARVGRGQLRPLEPYRRPGLRRRLAGPSARRQLLSRRHERGGVPRLHGPREGESLHAAPPRRSGRTEGRLVPRRLQGPHREDQVLPDGGSQLHDQAQRARVSPGPDRGLADR